MALSVGDALPDATLLMMGANGPEGISLHARLKGRKVVLFGLPGAYTGTCTTSHVPSFIRTAGQFAAKGVEEIICVSVNDPFVMGEWGASTGASAAGIAMLGDADGAWTKAIGMDFTVASIGLIGRSQRYALLAEDGVVKVLHVEVEDVCDLSTGEAMLAEI